MASGSKRKKDESYWNTQAKAANTAATEKSELEKRLEANSLETLDWSKKDGKDIRDLSTMTPYIQLADAARQRAGQEQMATGALALGDSGASGYGKQLQNLHEKETDREAGSLIENAYGNAYANASGTAMNLSQLDMQRRQGNAQNTGANWRYANQQSTRPGFWGGLFKDALVAGVGGFAGRPGGGGGGGGGGP